LRAESVLQSWVECKYSTMTIGVFGCSYADPLFGHDLNPELTETAWFYQLGSPAHSHGRNGAGLTWSYQQFLQHHAEYDQCVFVASAPWRYGASAVTTRTGRTVFVAGVSTADLLLRTPLAEDQVVRVRALRDYYLYLQDSKLDITIAELCLASVRQLRPDAIIIPVQPYGSFADSGVNTLADYTRLQAQALWGVDHPRLSGRGWLDRRLTCHFSPELNQLLAGHVRSALSEGQWGSYPLPESLELPHDYRYYYTPV